MRHILNKICLHHAGILCSFFSLPQFFRRLFQFLILLIHNSIRNFQTFIQPEYTEKENSSQGSQCKEEKKNKPGDIQLFLLYTQLQCIFFTFQLLASYYEDNQETKEFASIIEMNSTNLLRLVGDVLDISYLDQTECIPYKSVVEMNCLCQNSMDSVRPMVKEGVELFFKPACTELMVKTNPDRLSQILDHLLLNAAKFTQQGSITLEYKLDELGKQIVYSVTDTGKGIPQDKHEFVFERFAKLDDFTQGTGLGLPICRLLAEKFGGSLVIDAGYTQGCRFVLRLPLIHT